VEVEGQVYCFRCGAPAPRGATYCPRCGAPLDVHYVLRPPRPRLTPSLGLALTVLGAALYALGYTLAPLWLVPVLLESSFYLAVFGLGVMASATLWRWLKPWAIEPLFLVGALLTLVEHVAVFTFHVEAPTLLYLFKAGIALMAASTAAWLMARREARLLNIDVVKSRWPFASSLAAATLMSLVFAAGAPSALGVVEALAAAYTVGVAAWLLWHFYAPSVFKAYLGLSSTEEAVMVDRGLTREETGYAFTDILLRASTLALMAFSILVFGAQLFDPQLDLSSMGTLVLLAKYSLAAEVLLGVFGPPAYWLFEALDLRVLDRASATLEKASPIGFLDSMVDLFAALGFLLTIRDVTLSITPPDAAPALYAPLAFFNAILLLYYYASIVLPPALVATALYHKYSFEKQARWLLDEIRPRRLEEAAALLAEPPGASRS